MITSLNENDFLKVEFRKFSLDTITYKIISSNVLSQMTFVMRKHGYPYLPYHLACSIEKLTILLSYCF